MILHPRSFILGLLISLNSLDAQTPSLFRFPLASNPGITSWFDLNSSPSNRQRYDCDTAFSRDGHQGLDIAAPRNTAILAAASGVVYQNPITGCPDDTLHPTCGNLDSSPTAEGYGNHVRLRHGDGKVTIYANMLSTGVTLNSTPLCGAEIGRSGRSGGSTDYQLHFELWRDINIGKRLDFFSGACNSTGYWVSQTGASPGTGCQSDGTILPAITSFDITPRVATSGTQRVATVQGSAGSNPLSTASLIRTADLTGNSGWTTQATQRVSGTSVNVVLNDRPPVGTFLYSARLIDNTGQYGVEPSTVQVTTTPVGHSTDPEIIALTATQQQATWVYYSYRSGSTDQWYISRSSGETYLLSGAGGYGGELVWGQIANGNPVATMNYAAGTVTIASSALAQTSPTSYPGVKLSGGANITVSSSRGYSAAQLVAGQTVSHAWYFFKVQTTGTWYIVNLGGLDTQIYRLRLTSDKSNYDWFQLSSSSWKRSFLATASSMAITLSEQ